MRTIASRVLGILFVLCAVEMLFADPPTRVARLQYTSGEVSVQPGGVKDWVPGSINRPLTTADRVWTDKDSRTELQLGNSYIRMNSETSVTLTNLADQTVQVELDQGTLDLRIRHLYDGEIYEVDTPNLAFTVTRSGEYRFDVDPNNDATFVTVWQGEGVATGQGRSVEVHRGEQARFTDNDSLNHQISEAPDFDGFDDWCQVRNNRQDHYQSARYVSPDVIGAEDLDDYGTWRVLPSYGAVWVPTVAPGWAPYRYGHWVWIEPWGWTWVDDAPWGFAPSHYGRWVNYDGYWAWAPGPPRVRPVYAPALVAWVGGSHWGMSITFGGNSGVAWFPLGYGEPYVPPYHVSRNYFQTVNVNNTRITNITNITNNYYNTTNITNNTTNITNNNVNVNGNHNNVHITYANQTVPGAVTAVPRTVLVNAQPVGRAAMQVSEHEIRSAPVGVAPEIAPSRTSVLGANASSASSMAPAQMVTRPVVAKLPPPAKPVPFAMKQQALAAHPGRPLDERTEQQMRAQMGDRAMGQGNASANPHAAPMKPAPRLTDNEAAPTANVPVHNVPRPPARNLPANAASEPMRPASRLSDNPPAAQTMPAVRNVPQPPQRNAGSPQPAQNFPVRMVPRPPSTSTPKPMPVSAPDRPVFQSPQSRRNPATDSPERNPVRTEPAVRQVSNGQSQELSDRRPDPGYRPVSRPEPARPAPAARQAPRQNNSRSATPARPSGGSQATRGQSGHDESHGQQQR